MHFLVVGDTKMGIFEEILRQKVLASTNFCQILVLGDTLILRDNGVAVSTFATRLQNAHDNPEPRTESPPSLFLQQHGNSLIAKC